MCKECGCRSFTETTEYKAMSRGAVEILKMLDREGITDELRQTALQDYMSNVSVIYGGPPLEDLEESQKFNK